MISILQQLPSVNISFYTSFSVSRCLFQTKTYFKYYLFSVNLFFYRAHLDIRRVSYNIMRFIPIQREEENSEAIKPTFC